MMSVGWLVAWTCICAADDVLAAAQRSSEYGRKVVDLAKSVHALVLYTNLEYRNTDDSYTVSIFF